MLLNRVIRAAVLASVVGWMLMGAIPARVWGQEEARRGRGNQRHAAAKKGLILDTGKGLAGYTLFAPLDATRTYLVDMQGRVAHSWKSNYTPGQSVYLLDDGSLFRCAREPGNRHFEGGGIGGRVQRIAPDGTVNWEYVYADAKHCQHHDAAMLPNGNVLMIAWEKKSRDEVLSAGRDPKQFTGKELWPDCVVEVKPEGTSGGKIVWEWHAWDHMVQSHDKSKSNYGRIAAHAELVDLNYRPAGPHESPREVQRLRQMGYFGGGDGDGDRPPPPGDADDGDGPPLRGPGGEGPRGRGPGGMDMHADWLHTNAISYNAELDQIALSIHNFDEIWIIDHSTTTKEAAGHSGGRQGKGGDLLYRWGNPQAYGAGTAKQQQLFAQHDVEWIPRGLPGAGHLTIFNNGGGRRYSSVIEIAPPVDSAGRYARKSGAAFGPIKPTWEYTAPNKMAFYASHISGAQRLANRDTLICSGEQGRLFEVNPHGKTVWEFVNPYAGHHRPDGGFGPRPDAGDDRGDDGRQVDHRPPPRDDDGMESGDSPDDPRPPPPPDEDGDGGGRRHRGPGGRGGPPGGGGVFRATRLALDHPGVRRLLDANPSK